MGYLSKPTSYLVFHFFTERLLEREWNCRERSLKLIFPRGFLNIIIMTCWHCGFETTKLSTNAESPTCKDGPCQICTAVAKVDEEINQTVATLRLFLVKRCKSRTASMVLSVDSDSYLSNAAISVQSRTASMVLSVDSPSNSKLYI